MREKEDSGLVLLTMAGGGRRVLDDHANGFGPETMARQQHTNQRLDRTSFPQPLAVDCCTKCNVDDDSFSL